MWLITSDLHFTDVPRDAYRFGIIDRLIAAAVQHRATDIFILGDITDRKDNHSGAFINTLVKHFVRLFDETKARIHILQGNHDYSDPANPTLGFLPMLDIDIFWHGRRGAHNLVGAAKSGESVIMFPFCRGTDDFKSMLSRVPSANFVAAFFHQTFTGAKASSGVSMDGIPAVMVKKISAKRYFAGDIHVPQKIGDVEYVGSPYPIRFGDDFQPRFLRYDPKADGVWDERFKTIRKRTVYIDDVADIDGAGLKHGDQVKIRMKMSRDKFSDWKSIEADIIDAVNTAGAELYGVEIAEDVAGAPVDAAQTESNDASTIFTNFCDSNGVDGDLRKAGAAYL